MKNNILKFYTVAIYLCSTFIMMADPGTTNDTGTLENTDTPAAPIDDYVWIMALIGLIYVFMKLKNNSKQKVGN